MTRLDFNRLVPEVPQSSRQSNPTNRNAISINKALLITLPRRNLYSHPTAPVATQIHRLYIVLIPTPIPLNINEKFS
jgi:hypothetical protein